MDDSARKRLNSIYNGMKQRCYNKKGVNYSYYGGRGVTICEEWLNSFDSFYNWAINNGYEEDLTIDRIDNDKGYTPNNCKWSSKSEQCFNRSMSVKLTLDGRTMYMTEWASELGIGIKTLSWRYRKGWSDKEILTTPKDSNKKKLTFNGETHSMSEWGRILGIQVSTLSARLRSGWSVEETLSKRQDDREVKLTYENETKTISEWAKYLDVPKSRLNGRYKYGWTDEEIIEGKRR